MQQVLDLVVGPVVHFYATHPADPRTAEWPLMDSPVPTLALTLLYLTVIFVGQHMMKHREPFDLKWIIVAYNAFIVLLNAWIAYELIDSFFALNMSWKCNAVIQDPSNWNSMRIARACWWYYMSKCMEFLDTIFFMLRKKDQQISFLHLFHHSTMFNLWWMGVRWAPGGHSTPSAAVNATVHVIMYTYYGLAALGPQMKMYLWWKRYLTQMQLAQFFFIFGSTALAIYETRAGRCAFFEWMGWANLVYMIMMISLFMAFYERTYKEDKTHRGTSAAAAAPAATAADSTTTSSTSSTTSSLRRQVAAQSRSASVPLRTMTKAGLTSLPKEPLGQDDMAGRRVLEVGPLLRSGCALVASTMASLQPSFVAVDLQHGMTSGTAAMVAAAMAIHAHGVEAAVRVEGLSAASVGKALDAGFTTVICPMVDSPADAALLARACAYQPTGERSFGPLHRADTARPVRAFAMIETLNALQSIDAICQTPGLAGIFVGPHDLSLALGLPADPEGTTERMKEALARIARSATDHRITAGIHCSGAAMANAMTLLGYSFFTLATDMDHLRNSYRTMAAELHPVRQPSADASGDPTPPPTTRSTKRAAPASRKSAPVAKRAGAAAPSKASTDADNHARIHAWLVGMEAVECYYEHMQAQYEERTGTARPPSK